MEGFPSKIYHRKNYPAEVGLDSVVLLIKQECQLSNYYISSPVSSTLYTFNHSLFFKYFNFHFAYESTEIK